MKKIDLITGFLGSGKTTFIKYYAKYLVSKGEKVCILENDFGAVNVDMMLLSELRSDNLELEMVSGGCDKDCHRRRFKTKLIAMGMDDYTRIIVEPSGIFDVDEFFDSLYDEPLNKWYEIGTVIAIADARSGQNISETAREIMASEMANAGKIILSKTSLSSREDIENTKKQISESLKLIGCDRNITDDVVSKDWDELTDEDFFNISKASFKKGSYVKKNHNEYENFASLCFLEKKLTKDKILCKAGELFSNKKYGTVLRIKGFINEDGVWSEINATASEMRDEIIPDGQDVIIVIGENLNEKAISDFLDI